MQKIEAIIKPFKLDDVKDGLSSLGVKGLTVTEVRGFGRQRGYKEVYRGAEYQVDFVSKIKIEVVMESNLVQDAVKVIQEKARTDQIGDGKIFILPVKEPPADEYYGQEDNTGKKIGMIRYPLLHYSILLSLPQFLVPQHPA